MLYFIIGENVFGFVQLTKTSIIAFSQMIQFTVLVLTNVKFKHLGQLLLVLLIKHQVGFFSTQRKLDTFKLGGLTFSSTGSTKTKDSKSSISKGTKEFAKKINKEHLLEQFHLVKRQICYLKLKCFILIFYARNLNSIF